MKFRSCPKKFRLRRLNPSPSAKRFSTICRMYQAGKGKKEGFVFVKGSSNAFDGTKFSKLIYDEIVWPVK